MVGLLFCISCGQLSIWPESCFYGLGCRTQASWQQVNVIASLLSSQLFLVQEQPHWWKWLQWSRLRNIAALISRHLHSAGQLWTWPCGSSCFEPLWVYLLLLGKGQERIRFWTCPSWFWPKNKDVLVDHDSGPRTRMFWLITCFISKTLKLVWYQWKAINQPPFQNPWFNWLQKQNSEPSVNIQLHSGNGLFKFCSLNLAQCWFYNFYSDHSAKSQKKGSE